MFQFLFVGKESCLHEETSNQRLSNIDVVVFGCELRRRPPQIETVHNARQLLTNIIARF